MGRLQTGGLGQKRSLESRAGKLRRMARMLRKQGYKQASEKFATEAAIMKMDTPGIISQEYREAEARRQDALAKAKARRERMIDAYLDMYDQRGGMGGSTGQPTYPELGGNFMFPEGHPLAGAEKDLWSKTPKGDPIDPYYNLPYR